jgi:hypothetical protein
MKTKEKVIRQSIKILEKKISVLKDIMFGHHASELLTLQHETIKKVKSMPQGSTEAMTILDEAIEKEKQLKAKLYKSFNVKNTDKLVEYELELGQLSNELSLMGIRGEIKGC